MTKEEAINIIKQACASIAANLETHQQIQTAISVIEEYFKEAKDKK